MIRVGTSRKAKTIGTLLIVIALIPLLAAYCSYYLGWRPIKTTNQGELINPVISLPPAFVNHHWAILLVQQDRCEASCLKALDTLIRVRRILGKDIYRVQIAVSSRAGEKITLPYPGIESWTLSPEHYNLLRLYSRHQGVTGGDIYLVDPLGNVFMHYHHKVTVQAIYRDLSKVLAVSQIG